MAKGKTALSWLAMQHYSSAPPTCSTLSSTNHGPLHGNVASPSEPQVQGTEGQILHKRNSDVLLKASPESAKGPTLLFSSAARTFHTTANATSRTPKSVNYCLEKENPNHMCHRGQQSPPLPWQLRHTCRWHDHCQAPSHQHHLNKECTLLHQWPEGFLLQHPNWPTGIPVHEDQWPPSWFCQSLQPQRLDYQQRYNLLKIQKGVYGLLQAASLHRIS